MEHWSIVGRPKHIVEGGRLLGKHNITLSRLPSPPTQKGTSNFMIVSFRNTIIMVIGIAQVESKKTVAVMLDLKDRFLRLPKNSCCSNI